MAAGAVLAGALAGRAVFAEKPVVPAAEEEARCAH